MAVPAAKPTLAELRRLLPPTKPFDYIYIYAVQRPEFLPGQAVGLRPVLHDHHPRHPRHDGIANVYEGAVARVYKTEEVARLLARGDLIEIEEAEYLECLAGVVGHDARVIQVDAPIYVGRNAPFAPDLSNELETLGLSVGVLAKLQKRFMSIAELVELFDDGKEDTLTKAPFNLTDGQRINLRTVLENKGLIQPVGSGA